ncbi:type I-E CRISPR-associated protein Cse2/CasB [Nitriliruptoraceae bacterium ZYF776]|nr:type I-E CRISPR-associated protein Cse2/CasB [Profundirhabdus halotolerans]
MRAPYWVRHLDAQGRWRGSERPPGEDLAAMRRGARREPGTVPGLWGLHARLGDDRWADAEHVGVSPSLAAEHHALVLFGFHQQGLDRPVHRRGVGVGRAIRDLRDSGRYSPEAVERRFFAAVTAETVDEVAEHLRGLVQQLRVLRRAGDRGVLDYSRLMRDLERWHDPERRGGVRRTWATQYETPPRGQGDAAGDQTSEDDPAVAGD